MIRQGGAEGQHTREAYRNQVMNPHDQMHMADTTVKDIQDYLWLENDVIYMSSITTKIYSKKVIIICI